MPHDLAQVNIAHLIEPLDSAQLADFVAALDEVNAEADAADGFLWRLQGESGNATDVEAFQWDVGNAAGVIVNMSTWRSLEALQKYMYDGSHVAALRRRREWFHRPVAPTTALWWVPSGHRPTTAEAEERLRHLREYGPTAYAFTLRNAFAEPDAVGEAVLAAPSVGSQLPG